MNTPGRFLTKNYDSPDTTIRWVLEYSEQSDFSDLEELSLAGSSVFDKSQSLDVNGVDLDVKQEGGVIKSGRFVFTKKQPQDQFVFPRDGKLENGVIYYFKNYKVRQLNATYWCVRPERSQHSLYPSEVETRPRFLGVEGFPSVVRFLRHESVKNDRISIAWDEPLDSGNNRMTYTADAMNVSYGVTARPECGSDATCHARSGAGDATFQTSTLNYPLTGLYQGQLYTLLVRSQNEMGSSQAVSLLGRPVSAPEAPRDVAFLINPLNLTNGTGNRIGLVTWSPPLDTGLGVSCAGSEEWTRCGDYPLEVDRYRLAWLDCQSLPCSAKDIVAGASDSRPWAYRTLSGDTTTLQVNVSFAEEMYKFQVQAGNNQSSSLGSFSELGPNASTPSDGTNSGVLSSEPLQMRLVFREWLTNTSGGGVGESPETWLDPVQARGISDYCRKKNDTTQGVRNAEPCGNGNDVTATWTPPNDCELCEDPTLDVFVDSVYIFKVRALRQDISDTDYQTSQIRIEHNLAEALGSNWRSVANVTESTFECWRDTANLHASDSDSCRSCPHNTSYSTRGCYGWKELQVSFRANGEMASEGFDQFLEFTAITPSNKRSRMRVDVRIIGADPQFIDFKLAHDITMGCTFFTDVTAEDRTQLGLSRETAYEKNYLVSIAAIGGRIESRYRSTPFAALPGGAQLRPKGNTMATNNSITYRFQWKPDRFQEGFTYIVNLEARGYLGNTSVPGVSEEISPKKGPSFLRNISLSIKVLRCRFCTETADEMSLAKLASQWRASWLSIWRFVPFLISFVLISFVFISFGTLFLYLTWLFCVILFF